MTDGAADELVVYARDLLTRTDAGVAGYWQRAVAFLARQALESAIASVLAARAAGVERCSAAAQLLCLPTYVPTEAAFECSYLWSVLSRACHQHAYELDPTWDELAGWVNRVEVLSKVLAPSG